MNDWTSIIFCLFALLAVVSLPQLLWTRRTVQRVQMWLSDPRVGLELVPFASCSRWALWCWFLAVASALAVFVDASSALGSEAEATQAISAAVSLWCLLQIIVSWQSQRMCEMLSRFGAQRQLDEEGLAEAVRFLPAGAESVISEEVLRRRVNTLSFVSRSWLFVVLLLATGAVFVLIAAGLENIASSAGQLVLLMLVVLLPGIVALYVVRSVVEARARRAQFLWFLSATVQKQRPLASELMVWGRSHPGRYGARVLEAARDIGVGESLADALAAQHELLTPTDLLTVRVAEQTGTLPEALRDCAVRQTLALKGDSLVGSASGTGIWLWAVVVVAATIVSFVMYYIIPKFKMIFMGFGTELPSVTVLLITISDVFVRYGYLWSPVFAVLSWVFLKSCGEAFLRGWSETWLAWRLGFGRQAEVPRLLRRLRGAVSSKQPWTVALQPMVLKHPRYEIRSRLERVLGRVTAGMGVWPAMRDSGLLNARDVGLLEMAERANNLEWALAALAESKERALRHRWLMLLTVSIPIFTIAAGFLVLLICVAFFMPLVKLTNDLS